MEALVQLLVYGEDGTSRNNLVQDHGSLHTRCRAQAAEHGARSLRLHLHRHRCCVRAVGGVCRVGGGGDRLGGSGRHIYSKGEVSSTRNTRAVYTVHIHGLHCAHDRLYILLH